MAGRKLEHLNEAVRQKLSTILLREAGDPRFKTVTITNVEVAKDLSTARVGFSCFNPGIELEALAESLNKAAGFFSSSLARTLATRKTPKLHFHYDQGFDYAIEVDRLLVEAGGEGGEGRGGGEEESKDEGEDEGGESG